MLPAEDLRRHRKQRRNHKLRQRVMEGQLWQQVSGPEAEPGVRAIQRSEERQADHVVEMGVGQEQIAAERRAAAQVLAEQAQARAGVEHQQVLATAHLQAGSVAAVSAMALARASDGTAHAPEPHHEFGMLGQVGSPRLCRPVPRTAPGASPAAPRSIIFRSSIPPDPTKNSCAGCGSARFRDCEPWLNDGCRRAAATPDCGLPRHPARRRHGRPGRADRPGAPETP